MATDWIVRRAATDDVGALFHVRTQVRENALSLGELAALGVTPETAAAMVAASPCAFVAEHGRDVVGFSMIDPEEGSLFAAFVLPGFEGRGIGRALIARAEAALFERFDRIWLETDPTSRAARLYRRLGWREVESAGADVRMEKRRSPSSSP